jgi:hypothetical protein
MGQKPRLRKVRLWRKADIRGTPTSVKCQHVWPGRALQDRSSKTDERESCNNVSGL